MTVYKWKTGSHVRVDAQVAGDECARLERMGRLTPPELVDASRAEDAPLHGCFEWNDEVAAERYRETQAGYIIRSIEVVPSGMTEPVRAFVSIVESDERPRYVNTVVAVSEPDTREIVLQQALAELRAFERKYSGLQELAAVLDAIREVA